MWSSTSLCGEGFPTQNLSKEGKEKASDCTRYTERPYGANPTRLLQVSKLDDGWLTQESIASPWSPDVVSISFATNFFHTEYIRTEFFTLNLFYYCETNCQEWKCVLRIQCFFLKKIQRLILMLRNSVLEIQNQRAQIYFQRSTAPLRFTHDTFCVALRGKNVVFISICPGFWFPLPKDRWCGVHPSVLPTHQMNSLELSGKSHLILLSFPRLSHTSSPLLCLSTWSPPPLFSFPLLPNSTFHSALRPLFFFKFSLPLYCHIPASPPPLHPSTPPHSHPLKLYKGIIYPLSVETCRKLRTLKPCYRNRTYCYSCINTHERVCVQHTHTRAHTHHTLSLSHVKLEHPPPFRKQVLISFFNGTCARL